MDDATTELDQMQAAYKAAVEKWISAIRREEELASVNHEIADVDNWEQAHFTEDEIRNKVTAAQKRYEDALREKFFGFRSRPGPPRLAMKCLQAQATAQSVASQTAAAPI